MCLFVNFNGSRVKQRSRVKTNVMQTFCSGKVKLSETVKRLFKLAGKMSHESELMAVYTLAASFINMLTSF